MIAGRYRRESETSRTLETIKKLNTIVFMIRFLSISRFRFPGSLFIAKMYSSESVQHNPHEYRIVRGSKGNHWKRRYWVSKSPSKVVMHIDVKRNVI